MGMQMPTMPQQQTQAQTIQKIEKKPFQASCYFVKSPDEFNVDVLPGVYYVGINESEQELYIRKINDLGNPEFKTYKISEEKKEKTELQVIAERLENIENVLKGDKNATIAGN